MPNAARTACCLLLALPACRFGPPPLPAVAWGGLARDPARPHAAAALLAEHLGSEVPDALGAWLARAGRGERDLAVPADLAKRWNLACPAVPAAEVGPSTLRRLAECPLPQAFTGDHAADELVLARGNPVLALVLHQWLVDEGTDAATAAEVARAVRGALPWAADRWLDLPTVTGDATDAIAPVVVALDGAWGNGALVTPRGKDDRWIAAPLGPGGTGWAVEAWRGLAPAGGTGAVVAADAEASAQDLVRLAVSVGAPGGTVQVLGRLLEGDGIGSVALGIPADGQPVGVAVQVSPWGTDLWRNGDHVPPVAGCDPGGPTFCPSADIAMHLPALVAGAPVALSASALLPVADLVAVAGILQAQRVEVALDLTDSPCGPAPGGMVCVPGGATPMGSPSDPRNPPHMERISTFYLDRDLVQAAAWDACPVSPEAVKALNDPATDAAAPADGTGSKPPEHVVPYFCPRISNPDGGTAPATGLTWDAAHQYCTWTGMRLPTEWEWEKAARLSSGPNPLLPPLGETAQWTRSWMEASAASCGAACAGPDPLGPCGGSVPCHAASTRVIRGGSAAGAPTARLSTSPQARAGTGLRCALSGAESQDPPAFLGHGSAVVSPVRTHAPARLAQTPLPAPPDPTPPSAAELAILAGLAADAIDDKPVCGEETVRSWNFPRGKGGRSQMDCRDPITYVETNEKRLTTFLPYVVNQGGAYAGVGADQNYDLIALARSRWAFVFDYEPNVVRLHKVLKALILASDTPEAFVARFSPDGTDEAMDLIERTWSADPQMATIQRFYLGYQARLATIYKKALAPHPDDARYGWLAHPEQYAYIRTLHQQGRIVILPGDMLATRTMREIGRACRALDVPMRVFYTSNAPTSWGGNITPEWRANVGALPFDDDAVVLATWNHGAFGQTDYWHYNVQRALQYQARLQHPGYLFMIQLTWDRIPGGDPDLTLTGLAGE